MHDAADKGAVSSIIERQRKEKKDKLYIVVDDVNDRVIVGGAIALKIKHGDTVIILEDEFKSSYDCTKCGGTGKNRFDTPCSFCNGKGALLEIPDQAKARPTSGKIVAVGPDIATSKIGDRVAYSGYTGHLIPFKGNTRLRIMREIEYFCHIEEVDGQ